jgi:isopenicillin N synthase-like dioxygenase
MQSPGNIAPAEETIPILDLGPYLAGEYGADHSLAEQLRWASENIGFYFIRNHGVEQAMIDATFREAARFHALPMAAKEKLLINKHQIGYLPMGGAKMRSSAVNRNTKHDLNEAVFIRRERTADDPDVIAGKPWRGMNQWPDDLPGFRETVLAYWNRMERLGQGMLPLYDHALGLPPGYFRERFEGAHINLRLSHYPPSLAAEDHQFGIARTPTAGS